MDTTLQLLTGIAMVIVAVGIAALLFGFAKYWSGR